MRGATGQGRGLWLQAEFMAKGKTPQARYKRTCPILRLKAL
jgi:hypothetical protein